LSSVSIFDIDLNASGIALLSLFIACNILYYRLMSMLVFSQMVEEAIRHAQYRLYQDYQVAGLTDLAVYPSLPQAENTFANLEDDSSSFASRLASSFAISEALILILVPLIAMIWAAYVIVSSPLIGGAVSVFAVVVSIVIMLRGFSLMLHAARQVA
jgi:hypothetical protein